MALWMRVESIPISLAASESLLSLWVKGVEFI
jgi:hypothetical protein